MYLSRHRAIVWTRCNKLTFYKCFWCLNYRAKGGNVRQDTEWRLKLPVTVIKSCETSGEIYKGQERF